jgi:hypothetical protein
MVRVFVWLSVQIWTGGDFGIGAAVKVKQGRGRALLRALVLGQIVDSVIG